MSGTGASVRMGTSGSQALRLSGSQALRLSGSQALRLSGSQALRLSGSQALNKMTLAVSSQLRLQTRGTADCSRPGRATIERGSKAM